MSVNNDNDNSNGKRPPSRMKFFILIVTAVVGVFVLIAAVAVFGYLLTSPSQSKEGINGLIVLEDGEITFEPADGASFNEGVYLPPSRTTVMVLGLDKSELLADVVIIATFERDTQEVNIISVPRDTRVDFTNAELTDLRAAGRKPPDTVKLTEVHSYAGPQLAMDTMERVLERILNIKIDYYVAVNTKAFRQIVDTVGYIEMTIPPGIKYEDPEQDLYINVPSGFQRLTGEMAEGLVRYRGYAAGDLKRIEVQHEFMSEFFRQVLNKQTIMDNAISFATTVFNYVRTDFPVTEMTKYIKYIGDLSPDKFKTQRVPGSADNSKYFEIDYSALPALVNEIFYKPSTLSSSLPTFAPTESVSSTDRAEDPESTSSPDSTGSPKSTSSPGSAGSTRSTSSPDDSAASSKGLRIQVLNGAGIGGIAAAYRDKLTDEGYNIAAIGDYSGERQRYTRVMVRERGQGEDLKQYFKDVSIQIDAEIPSAYDIIIIIGSGEEK